jgi:segregation and condensation protein B
MTLQQIIEALIFASQKPLLPKEIVAAIRSAASSAPEHPELQAFAGIKEPEIAAQLEELKIGYIQSERGFQLVEQVNGWQIVTHPEAGPWVRQLYPESKPVRLSGPALETLAIIAYRQPITRADIEAVRGVAVDGVMQSILDRGLIRIAGRADVPGRPLLYETTQYFLEHFGLRSLEELPNSHELRRMNLPTAPQPEPAPEQMELGASASPAPESESAAQAEAAPEEPAPDEPVPSEPQNQEPQ